MPDEEKNFNFLFFRLLCGASKGFTKVLKAPQRSVKIKIQLNFYFNINFSNTQDRRVKQI